VDRGRCPSTRDGAACFSAVDQGERAALLATKFAVPQVRPDLVPRPRLLERLDEQAAHKLLMVCTPAGFGKTTLLTGWAHGARWPVSWLSLDAHDNDPARFWGYLVAALDRVRPGIGEPVLALFTAPTRPSGEAVVTALVNEVAALPDQLGLVLDDYRVMESQQVHQAVTFLLAHLPPQLHVVIASRTDPPPLARLRARPPATPGSQSLLVASGDHAVLLRGDVANHPAQISEPTWCPRSDVQPETARQTGSELLDRWRPSGCGSRQRTSQSRSAPSPGSKAVAAGARTSPRPWRTGQRPGCLVRLPRGGEGAGGEPVRRGGDRLTGEHAEPGQVEGGRAVPTAAAAALPYRAWVSTPEVLARLGQQPHNTAARNLRAA